MAETNNHIPKLPNAPLQEVIFELRWKLDFDQETQSHVDKEFQFAFAKFTALSTSKTKHMVNLRPSFVAESIFNNRPVYQYWADKSLYPVFQLGPGVFTVNETEKNYTWPYFKELIIQGVEWLTKSYPAKLEFSVAELRYIDAIELNDGNERDFTKFIAENLGITIKIDSVDASVNDLQLHQRFSFDEENFLSLLVANGTKNINQNKAIILQISYNKTTSVTLDDLEKWVEKAHSTCSALFRKMISKELYERFSKTN